MNHVSEIRVATLADAEKITAVINAAFRIAEEFFVDGNRITLAEVQESFARGAFLVACDDDVVSGCVYVEPRGERAYLGLLSVDPARQQSGLGSRLMTAGEEYCRARGAQVMDIYIVNLRTELPAFYRQRGYFENGTTPFPPEVPTKQPCHFINMSKPL
jgi:predicted N-acetyltransferase YhbS